MKFIELTQGCYWLNVEEVDLRLLCGPPPDVMKLMAGNGLIDSYEIKGFYAEHGPNAILLYENNFAGDMAANLAEFPILQMFYNQGMGLDFHPNFGQRPLLIGMSEMLNKQLSYINIGNSGLSYVEMSKTKALPDIVDIWFYMKAKFAGSIDLIDHLDLIKMDSGHVEIKSGVFLDRLGVNKYRLTYRNQTKEFDLNIPSQPGLKPHYKLKKRVLPSATFAVVNTGTGDGWNPKEPCFGSLLIYKDQYFLVDFEAYTLANLKNLNLEFEDIKGIFMTHCHDDHMSGLPNLLQAKKKMPLYCTLLVYRSLLMKVCGLLGCSEEDFLNNFPHHALQYETWNDVNGLEVIPFHSAHPVETSIFVFRVQHGNMHKVYAHLGDIAPFQVIKKFRDQAIKDYDRDFYTNMMKNYLIPADLKKIDIGGGSIHGLAADFEKDTSAKIILGHYHRKLNSKELKVGSTQTFGDIDILIP